MLYDIQLQHHDVKRRNKKAAAEVKFLKIHHKVADVIQIALHKRICMQSCHVHASKLLFLGDMVGNKLTTGLADVRE